MITAVLTVAILIAASAASAAGGGTATVTLTPSKAKAAASAAVSISGVTGFSTLPTSVDLLLQPGFTSSLNSVTALCTSAEASSSMCPPASGIGTGSVGIRFFGSPATVPVNLFLGAPLQAGDIASVILVGSLGGTNLDVSGRLFTPAQGGVEVLLSGFPSAPVTLDSFSFSLAASRSVSSIVTKTVIKTVIKKIFVGKGKNRHKKKVKRKVKTKLRTTVTTVYSLITDPRTCSGTWTGTATLTYTSGSDVLPLSTPCTP
jgi:hypothetical protein